MYSSNRGDYGDALLHHYLRDAAETHLSDWLLVPLAQVNLAVPMHDIFEIHTPGLGKINEGA
jgi:hypothetical protein